MSRKQKLSLPSAGTMNRGQPFLCHMYCVVPSFSTWWAVSAPRRGKGVFIIKLPRWTCGWAGQLLGICNEGHFRCFPSSFPQGFLNSLVSKRVANRLGSSFGLVLPPWSN